MASQPPGHEIHVIADNLSADKTKLVEDFLANPQVRIILHPPILPGLTKSKSGSPKFKGRSSLEASSVDDLRRKILRYVRDYNKTATPSNGLTPRLPNQ